MKDSSKTQAQTRAGLEPFERAVRKVLRLREELREECREEYTEEQELDALVFWSEVARGFTPAVVEEAYLRWCTRHIHSTVRKAVERARLRAAAV